MCTFILRPDQKFICGKDLSCDLKNLHGHYANLPEEVKVTGLVRFASRPPYDNMGLIAQLWDQYLKPWRQKEEKKEVLKSEKREDLINYLEKVRNAPLLPENELLIDSDNVNVVVVPRHIHKKKGRFGNFLKT